MFEGDKMIKGSSFGSRVRKRLSDITNIQSNPKSPFKDQLNDNQDSSTNNYVQNLLKENALMSKLIEEKDKIIESNGVELQKLRGNLRRMQLQNWHLAQSNSQMLAELNMSKDRLKALQHDLACKDALYKAKMHDAQVKEKMQAEENIKLEGKTKPEKEDVDQSKQANDNNENRVSKTKRGRVIRSQSLGVTNSQQDVNKEIAENKRGRRTLMEVMEMQDIYVMCGYVNTKEGKIKSEKADVDQPKQTNDNNENRVSKTKRERVTRSQSLGATNSQQDVDKEIAENKRRCLRRQSVRLKPEESDADLYEIDVNAPLTQSLEGPPRFSISDKEEPSLSSVSDKTEPSPSSVSDREEPSRSSISDKEEPLSQSLKPTLPPQRTSVGRPSRKAAEKVQSYKDIPLNVKMRRPS